jgi:hypothetical protein
MESEPTLHELRVILDQINQTRELIGQLHALGLTRPGFALVGPYDHASSDLNHETSRGR